MEAKFKKFTQYYINLEYINEQYACSFKKANNPPEQKTFSEIIAFFRSQKIFEEPILCAWSSSVNVQCENEKCEVACGHRMINDILVVLLKLMKEGKSLNCPWYFYEHAECRELPQFLDYFFLVDSSNEIVNCDATISSSYLGDKIDVEVLEPYEPIGLWDNDLENLEAVISWSYNKFYSETYKGQICAVKDKNKVHVSPELPLSDDIVQFNKSLASIEGILRWTFYGLIGIILVLVYKL